MTSVPIVYEVKVNVAWPVPSVVASDVLPLFGPVTNVIFGIRGSVGESVTKQ
jgi:hypothetical protein